MTFTIPIGPQHPALKEPAHFEFDVDGEIITAATVRLGYAHRGIEKAAESRNFTQTLYLMERVCGICSHIHAATYVRAVETLAGVTITDRAKAIRVLVAEMERIHSHLLWLGVAAHNAGFEALFMTSWRDRETIMSLLEAFSGSRVHYSVNVLGGVKVDVTPELSSSIIKGVDYLEERTTHYLSIIHKDSLFKRRTQGIGRMTAEQAQRWGVVGPLARASGLARDVRLDAPYDAYDTFRVKPVMLTAGDLQARFVVRLQELFESYRLIREVLANLPEGDLTVRFPRRIRQAGEVIARSEAPRGELFYFVRSEGGDGPSRVKVRTPTMPNMASVLHTTIGAQLADAPMILVGIDPCFSCNDRTSLVRQGDHARLWTWERLRRYGIDTYASE